MLQLPEKNKSLLRKHGEHISDKLTQLAHESKKRKLVIHDKKGTRFFEFPLLLVVIAIVALPIFAGLTIWFLLLANFNAVIEKMHDHEFD